MINYYADELKKATTFSRIYLIELQYYHDIRITYQDILILDRIFYDKLYQITVKNKQFESSPYTFELRKDLKEQKELVRKVSKND